MKKYTCKQCGKDFERPNKSYIKYCSRECRFKKMFTGRMITCLQCRKKKYREKSYYRRSKKYFCSHECANLYKRINSHGRINPTKELRLKVLEYYNYTCAYCKKVKHEIMVPLQLHHLDGGVRNTVFENLVPLCVSCHRKTQRNIPLKRHISESFIVNLCQRPYFKG